jgi:hypothetical protein
VKRVVILFGLIILLIGPNLLWLNRSTIRIENRSAQRIEDVVLYACSQPRSLGPLAPGSSRFHVLPKCGDDSLEVRSGLTSTSCRIYVEGEMYHIRAWFSSPTTGDCTYGGMPPFSPLLLTELL